MEPPHLRRRARNRQRPEPRPTFLLPGLYKLSFVTPTGVDHGVAYLRDGRWRGGDSGMAYVGTYKAENGWLTAELCVTQHRQVPGVVSALGYNDLVVKLEGECGESTAEVRRSSRELPSVRFRARLAHTAD